MGWLPSAAAGLLLVTGGQAAPHGRTGLRGPAPRAWWRSAPPLFAGTPATGRVRCSLSAPPRARERVWGSPHAGLQSGRLVQGKLPPVPCGWAATPSLPCGAGRSQGQPALLYQSSSAAECSGDRSEPKPRALAGQFGCGWWAAAAAATRRAQRGWHMPYVINPSSGHQRSPGAPTGTQVLEALDEACEVRGGGKTPSGALVRRTAPADCCCWTTKTTSASWAARQGRPGRQPAAASACLQGGRLWRTTC